MFSEDYSDIVIDHFMCPRNLGMVQDANGEGKIGDPGCGDSLNMYIRVKNDVIEDISYLVYGCPGSIATSSMTTELVMGKTIEEALKLTEDDVVKALGGLPESKIHCSVLAVKALRNAIDDYYKKSINKEDKK
jgi:nitrogen fixation NifU-like protein